MVLYVKLQRLGMMPELRAIAACQCCVASSSLLTQTSPGIGTS